MLKLYLSYILIIFLHELGHYFALKSFNITVTQVLIGNAFYIRLRRIKISPIVLTAHVEFSKRQFNELTILPKLIIISSGSLINLLIFFLFPVHQSILRYMSLYVGITSLLPIPFTETDGANIIKEINYSLSKCKLLKRPMR